MKFSLITAVTALSTLASGMVILDLDPAPFALARTFRPSIAIVIEEQFPDTAYTPTHWGRTSRTNGSKNVKALLGFNLPAFPDGKSCTIGFSDGNKASGSRQMQLFTTGGYPAYGDTWNKKPYTDQHKGTFEVLKEDGKGPAKVLANYGLTFPCPTVATSYGFEVQPVNDNDYVVWDITAGGFVITANY